MPKKTAKRNYKTKLALLVLGIILVLILIGKAIGTINHLNEPISQGNTVSRFHLWDRKSNLNLIVIGKDIAVVSFNPQDKTIAVVNIPDSLYLNVPGGFGSWQIASVYNLGQAEKQRIGGKLLKSSVTSLLGVSIDGYIVFEGSFKDQNVHDLVEMLKGSKFSFLKVLGDIQTDLTLREFFDLSQGMSFVRFDKVENVDLVKLNLLGKSKLPDGTSVFISDPDRIDSISSHFTENLISDSKVSVAVYNGTEIQGLAQKVSRMISNLGGNVIISTTSKEKFSKSMIVVKDSKSSEVVERLGEIFTSDCSNSLKCDIILCEIGKNYNPNDRCNIKDAVILESRAQISVVLGEDTSTL